MDFVACHCIAYMLLNMLYYVARQNIMWQERNLDFFLSNHRTTFHFPGHALWNKASFSLPLLD